MESFGRQERQKKGRFFVFLKIAEKITGFFQGLFFGFIKFIHTYVLELIITAFMLLGLFWTIGYFANALYGYHFELQSCWGGFTAIGGAGTLAAVKYVMDSWKNSPEGEAPKTVKAFNNIIDTYVSHQPNKTEVNISMPKETSAEEQIKEMAKRQKK